MCGRNTYAKDEEIQISGYNLEYHSGRSANSGRI